MKIGIYTGDLAPTQGGGYTFVRELVGAVEGLSSISPHKIVILERSQLPTAPRRTLGRRVLARLGWRLPTTEGLVSRWIKEQQIDFLISLVPWEVPCYDIPYSQIVWDLQHRLQPYFPEVSANGEWEKRESVYRRSLPQASFVIVGTEAGRSEVERFYGVPSERIVLFPHPSPDFSSLKPDGTILKKHAISSPYLFYPAQFWPHKNHVNLLLSLHQLRTHHHLPFSLVLSGSDQGNRSYVEEVTNRLGLTNYVHFLGFVNREQLMALYQNAFALTYPSFFGPENLPPLEAFSLGCPVIAARVSGASEQLGQNALLVNPCKPAEMAAAVRRLHSDNLLREDLIRRGRQRSGQFSPRHFAQRLLELMDNFEFIRRVWPNSFIWKETDRLAQSAPLWAAA